MKHRERRKPEKPNKSRKKEPHQSQASEKGAKQAADTGKEADKTWFQKYWLPALITLMTTVIGGVTLAYFKGELWRKPPMRAAFEKPLVQTNVALRDFSMERGVDTTVYTEEQLAQVGYITNFKVQIDGFKGRTCKLRWELFDVEKRERIVPPGWNAVQDPVDLKPERDSDSAASEFWVPPTGSDRPFFVRVRLFDDKNVELDFEDSDAVTPRASAQTSPSPTPSAGPGKPKLRASPK